MKNEKYSTFCTYTGIKKYEYSNIFVCHPKGNISPGYSHCKAACKLFSFQLAANLRCKKALITS